MKKIIAILCFVFLGVTCGVAQDKRIQDISKKLEQLSKTTTPGLDSVVSFSVSGVSIQEFIRGLAETSRLNISVDPTLRQKIVNNFTQERVKNIILYLCKEYDLELVFTGSIMSFKPYVAPEPKVAPPKPNEIDITYNNRKELLTADLQNDELGKVTKKITQLSKINIIVPSSLINKPVNGYFEDLSVEQGLNKLAYANELSIDKSEDGVYLLREKPKEIESGKGKYSSKGRGKGKKSTQSEDLDVSVYDGPNGEKLIDLNAVDVAIVDAIKAVSDEIEAGYFMFSEPKGNTSVQIKGVPYKDFLSHILQGSNHTYLVDEELYLIGERNLEGLRSTKVVQLEYRSVDEMVNLIPSELRKGVEISEFREQNSIVLSGASPQIKEIVGFLHLVDKVVPMVMIEVIILDIRKGKTFRAGVKAGLLGPSDSSSAGGSILPTPNFTFSAGALNRFLTTITAGTAINIGKVAPNFYLSLSALDGKSYANVRQMPKLATLNGHEANMSIGTSRYYSIETSNLIGTQNPVVQSTQQYNEVQANLSININPVVSGDEQVTLDIQVEISDFIGTPPDNAPPASATSQFKSLVRATNDDMIVLGGIERYETSESGSGVPILSRIPLIKLFFSSRERNKNKTLTTIFIKPTIIY